MKAFEFISRLDDARHARRVSEDGIPAPVAAAPSHAPTSGKDATTTGQGKSEDEGEAISKEAMKETLRQLIDGDDTDVAALLSEGGHKAGCQCGFCKNKGSFGKKKDEGVGKTKDGEQPDKAMKEDLGMAGAGRGMPLRRRLGGAPPSRMNFRQRVKLPPKACGVPSKAAINPMQPAMEQLDGRASIQDIADRLLEAPGAD